MYEVKTGRMYPRGGVYFVLHFSISYIWQVFLQEAGRKMLNLSSAIESHVKHIVISKGTEFLRVPSDRLMYVSSDGNYSNVVTLDG